MSPPKPTPVVSEQPSGLDLAGERGERYRIRRGIEKTEYDSAEAEEKGISVDELHAQRANAPKGASIADIIALRTEHGAEEAGTKLANDPRFRGLSKTERTNAIRDIAGDEAGLLPSGAQRDIDAKLGKMGPQEAKAYLAKAPNATAYNYIAKQMKVLGLLVDEE